MEPAEAGKRLEAFEKMLAGIQERYEDTKRKTGKRWSEIDMSGSVKTMLRISGRINRKGYGILILWIGCRGVAWNRWKRYRQCRNL